MSSCALVTVAGGVVYERYAEHLMESARRFFKPTDIVELHVLAGDEGWPNGTMMRHHRLLEALPRVQYVFLCDADMRFVAPVGPEVLPGEYGITATLHPGFAGRSRVELPYETNDRSLAYVGPDEGGLYYCGGFVGGERLAMRMLSTQITTIIDMDGERGIVPVWHDESALNRVLATDPPDVTLSPSFCYPDNDAWYRTFWPESYERRLVAIDKTAAERSGR